MRILRTLVQVTLLAPILVGSTARAQLNTRGDDYAASFRVGPDGRTELWFTSSRASTDGRSRAIYIADCNDSGFANIHPAPAPINDTTSELMLNGTPTFALCDANSGMIVSNRSNGGTYSGNDIYRIALNAGRWSAERLEDVNSNDWDDSPSLSTDGTRLYFASDRANPGARRADLYMAERRADGSWSAPQPLAAVNTDTYSEETPFVSQDGYLYYSTNRSGDFDIWRTKLDERGAPVGIGEPVAGVNTVGTDETHPVISPASGFLVYSTNSDGSGHRKDFDITWVKLKRREVSLQIDVRKRYRQSTKRVGARLNVCSIVNDNERTIRFTTSADNPSAIPLDSLLGEPLTPASDTRKFTVIVSATPDSMSFVSAVDTLVGYRTCSSFLPHTVFLWDTATYYEQRCVDTFPIKKVQYFVTGYWCPTTKRFASYLSCPTLFLDSACLQPVCAPNDLYQYRVEVARAHSECIDYSEFDQKGAGFASAVDDAIEQHIKAMESAFGSACMKRTIEQRRPVHVVVEGFTDPRGYGSDCHYFGPDVDFTTSSIQVPEEMKPHFRHDARMKAYGAQGNQLLSELRAYNLASLLDRLWMERIPQYRELKEAGLLTTLAIGRAISQDDIPFDQRRSAQVSIAAESEGVIIPGHVPPPGQRVVLCDGCE